MTSLSMTSKAPAIVVSDSLGPTVRNIVELSKAYNTIILLYEDDFSDNVLASWAEVDRLNLKTKKIAEVYDSIDVHTFGLDHFPTGTVLELHLRDISQETKRQDIQRSAYKSLLNELSMISVRVYRSGGEMSLQ